MSADNWGKCPQCIRIAEKARSDAEKKLMDSYGKISAKEWLKLKETVPSGEIDETTLREDYQICIDEDGLFYVDYRASCSICDFEFEYKYDKEV